MKKKFICFLSFVAVFGLWSCSSDDLLNVDPVDTGKVTSVSIDKSFEKAQDLFNSFRPKVTRSEEMGQIDYPDYFGGCYIDENGTLNVLVKGKLENNVALLSSVVGSDGVSYEECLYSRNELMSLKEQIANYVVNNSDSPVSKNIDFTAFSCKKNRVIVGLKSCSDSDIALFKSIVLDAEPLVFIASDTRNVEQGDVASGQQIYAGGYNGSVGYKANYGGDTGFVTAAHLVGSGESVYLGSNHSQKIATCKTAMHQGTVDAAFCSMNSGWYMNIGVYGQSYVNINPYEGNTVEGSWVKKYGYNGYSEGYVIDESYDTWVSNVYMMDLAKTTYASTGGDSGGLILSQTNGYIMGIHQSGSNGTGNYCKVGNINYMLGITLATW